MLKKYVVALYCRLSRADAEFGQVTNESASIKNQIDQLLKYVAKMPEYKQMEVLTFTDDGYSGRNFERPDFIKMRGMILERKIDCVIVKDFSRFGRDYIELGDYLEQVFPVYNVRFISVNDNFDTKTEIDPNPVSVALKNLIYTYYSKDLSRKAHKSVEQRKREGRFTCGPVRFGFVKKDGSKTELLIDEKAAEIIRYIFTLAGSGIKTKAIAIRLNEEGVMTPAMYSYKFNQKCKWNTVNQQNNWTASGVAKILRDERYTGTYLEYVDGDNEQECIRIPGKYPAVVNYKTFYQAQAVMIDRKRPQEIKGSDNVFKGVIKCGNCNHALALSRAKKDRYYYCKNVGFDAGQGCSGEHFSEMELKECVRKAIQDYVAMLDLAGEEKVRDYRRQSRQLDKVDKNSWEKESKALEQEFFSLYEQYKSGVLYKESFTEKRDVVNRCKEEVEQKLVLLCEQGNKVIELEERREQFRYEQITELSEMVVKKNVKKVIVNGKNDVKIVWKMKNPFVGLLVEFSDRIERR